MAQIPDYTEAATPEANWWMVGQDPDESNLALKTKSIQLQNVLKAAQNQFFAAAATELTVSSGAITVTQLTHKLQPESGTADQIDTINGMTEGEFAILYASDAGTDTLVFRHGTGNLSCRGGVDIALSNGFLMVYSNGTTVFVLGAGYHTTLIEGMGLLWNSATSISVKTGHCYAQDGSEIEVTSTLTASGLSLSSSTWYHVYVYLSSGSPAIEVVTTAPTAWKATAYSKTGNTARRYLGSVKTDASGNIFEFTHDVSNDLMVYSGGVVMTAAPHRILNGGTATSATEVDGSAVIAVTSEVGYVRFVNTADVSAQFGSTTGTSNLILNPGSTAVQNAFANFAMTSTPGIYYKMGGTPGSGAAYIDVYGYYFGR